MIAQTIRFLNSLGIRISFSPFPILETAKKVYLLPPQYCNGFLTLINCGLYI